MGGGQLPPPPPPFDASSCRLHTPLNTLGTVIIIHLFSSAAVCSHSSTRCSSSSTPHHSQIPVKLGG